MARKRDGGNKYVRLVLALVGSCLSAPFFGVWAVLQPLLEHQGVFASVCNATDTADSAANVTAATSNSAGDSEANAANATTVVGYCALQDQVTSSAAELGFVMNIIFYYILGGTFDVFGPKVSTTLGALGTAISLLIVALVLALPEQLSWLMFFAFVININAGSLSSLSPMAFLWKFPENQTFLSGLSTLALTFGGVIVSIGPITLMPLMAGVLTLAALAFLGGLLLLYSVPSQDEYNSDAEAALGTLPATTQCSCFDILCKPFCLTCKIICLRCPENVAYLMFSSIVFGLFTYWMGASQLYFTAALHSQTKGLQMGAYMAYMTAFTGFFAPCIGVVGDKCGTLSMFMILITIMISTCILVWIPTESAMLVMTFLNSWLGTIILILYLKWASLFAEPENFGSFMGGFQSYAGLCAFGVIAASSFVPTLITADTFETLQIPLAIMSFLALVSGIILTTILCCKGLPTEPPKLDEDGYSETGEDLTESSEFDDDEDS